MRAADPGVAGRRAVLALALLGLALSAYLTAEHYTGSSTLACSASGVIDCLRVTTSPQSVLLGVPVAVWGLLYFAGMTVLALPPAWRRAGLHRPRVVAAVAGVAFVLYLLYTELFTLDAVCLWCTAVHVVTAALLLAVLLVDPHAGVTAAPQPAIQPAARSAGRTAERG
ncbi:MAG TPA: vitamin K epoxide reductase family protein [Mycobacteriales bacterium]|nr:vitamin K epoxide reductase family protein [Mycobacteriales bacterium]